MRQHRILILALLLPWTVLVPAADISTVFADNCTACHGNDGSANTPQGRKVKARDLRSSTLSDAEIERQIREGSKKKSGSSVMPAFGRDLTDDQIQEAIRTVKSFRQPASK